MSSSKQTKFSGTKAAGVSILALCLLAFSQLLALLIGNMLVAGGMSAVTGNIFTGILYVGLVLGGVFLICKKMLKIPMADFKIGKPDLYPFWIIAAFAMPLLVILIYQLFAGTWRRNLRSRNIKTACCRKCCIFRIGNRNRGRNGIPRNYYEFSGICMEPENCSDRSICPVWLSAY